MGVCIMTGDCSVRSFSDSVRDAVLGGVGGRADKGLRTSTIFQERKSEEGMEQRE
jgi:hypothetical protein